MWCVVPPSAPQKLFSSSFRFTKQTAPTAAATTGGEGGRDATILFCCFEFCLLVFSQRFFVVNFFLQ
jgi:hypothetical protein